MKFTREQKILIAALEIEFDANMYLIGEGLESTTLSFNTREDKIQRDLFYIRFSKDGKTSFKYKSYQYLVNDIESADSVIKHIEDFKKEYKKEEQRVNKFFNMSYEQLLDYVKNNIEKAIDRLGIGSENE